MIVLITINAKYKKKTNKQKNQIDNLININKN